MKLIEYLQSKPTLFITLIISMVSICIIMMLIFLHARYRHEKKITSAALELNKITNSIRAGLVNFVLEDKCKILYASKGFYELLGYSKKEVRDENKLNLYFFIHPRDKENFLKSEELFESSKVNLETRMLTKTGEILYILINGNSSLGRDGKHIVSAVIVDISKQKQMQEMLILEGERYRIAAELSKDILFEYNISSDEMIYTEKFRDLFGRNPDITHFSKNLEARRELIHPDDWGIYLEFCRELNEGRNKVEAEFRMKDQLSEFIWCQAMGKTIYDDERQPIRVIGKIVNVDTQKRVLEDLEYKATRDPLTGVYNKEITIKKIDKYINGNKNGRHILMFIDFDDFKQVNDTYGHLVGDKILTYVVSRIKGVFAEGEIIGRIGGDEFIVFTGNINKLDDIMNKAEALISALYTTYEEGGMAIPISGSIGIASYPEDGLHYEQLIECADKALYFVKKQGKNNYMLYNQLSEVLL